MVCGRQRSPHLGILMGCRQDPRGSSSDWLVLSWVPGSTSQNNPESLLRPEDQESCLERFLVRGSERQGPSGVRVEAGPALLKERLHSHTREHIPPDFSKVSTFSPVGCEWEVGVPVGRDPHFNFL